MKPKKQLLTLPPIIKGVPTEEVLALWSSGHAHRWIQSRYPTLTYMDIEDIVYFRKHTRIQMSVAEGKTTSQIAKELRCSASNVWVIQKKMERNEFLRTAWGGLSSRAVTFLKKRGYKTLLQLQKNPPTKEELYWMKGIGLYMRNEIQSVIPHRSGEHPKDVTKSPAPGIQEPPFREIRDVPIMYVTKASHFKDALNDPAAPEPARQVAEFFGAVVKFAQKVVALDEGGMLPSDIPCMAGPEPRRFCLGVLSIGWVHNPLRIYWGCPRCEKTGVVTDVDAPPLSSGPLSPGERLQ